jgi:hypothetical protein
MRHTGQLGNASLLLPSSIGRNLLRRGLEDLQLPLLADFKENLASSQGLISRVLSD